MFTISVTENTAAVIRQIGARPDQLRFATAVALTRTAQAVKVDEQHEMVDVFDRPTPYTLNALYLKPATKADLTAVVWLKDDRAGSGGTPDRYLLPEIRGGFRRNKAFEIALQRVGALPPGWVVVPGAACKLDAYGNISRGLIVQILSYLRTFDVAGYSANITPERKAKLARGTKRQAGFVYFVGRPGDGRLPLGIWQRFIFGHGSAIKPVFIFVDGAKYRPIFDFDYVARETVARVFAGEFRTAAALAMATAR